MRRGCAVQGVSYPQYQGRVCSTTRDTPSHYTAHPLFIMYIVYTGRTYYLYTSQCNKVINVAIVAVTLCHGFATEKFHLKSSEPSIMQYRLNPIVFNTLINSVFNRLLGLTSLSKFV